MNAQRATLPLVQLRPGVTRLVAGEDGLPQDRLKRRLGETSFFVWTVLCGLRNERGEVAHCLDVIAQRIGTKESNIKDVIERLERAKLVERVGWREVRHRQGTRLAYVRRVRGCPAVWGGTIAAVPRVTVTWFENEPRGGARPNSGGARIGAGRPPKNSANAPPRNQQSTPDPLGLEFSKAPPDLRSFSSLSSSSICSSSYEEERALRAPPSFLEKSAKPRESSMPAHALFPVRSSATPTASENAAVRDLWSDVVGRSRPMARHPIVFGAPHPALPPDVNIASLVARQPAPPLLDPRDTPERHAFLLVRWFEGAVEAGTGKRCWTFRVERKHITDSKHWNIVAGAAKKFIEHNIAPAAYLAWAQDRWSKDHGRKPMPIPWAFGATNIDSTRHLFRRESLGYEGGTLIYGSAPRKLLEMQARLRNALWSIPADAPDEIVTRVVESIFPPGSFDRLVSAAKAEALETARQLAEKIALGGWIW